MALNASVVNGDEVARKPHHLSKPAQTAIRRNAAKETHANVRPLFTIDMAPPPQKGGMDLTFLKHRSATPLLRLGLLFG
jgi:hypothetical protein